MITIPVRTSAGFASQWFDNHVSVQANWKQNCCFAINYDMTPTPGLLVAVVEDDESVRNSLLRLLRSTGRNAVAYASAEDFLRSYPQDLPCCLVLDLHLRGMSGADLLEMLARDNIKIPVVFITANEDEGFEKRLREADVTCLCKPFDEATLIQAIDLAMGRPPARWAGQQ